ncbi:four helix bundle protein [Flavobacterium cheonhonense]|uniref:Four helix bundle protein n=2 Tax=Flavobacterium cheonhonense TaxID=706185 RepID=A0ABP7TS39_9FLAO
MAEFFLFLCNKKLKNMKAFRDLLIWQKAMNLVTNTYQITQKFPKEELFGLTSQIRRSAISLPSNIAEGYGRDSNKEYLRFIKIVIGSLFEFQTQIEIAKNINYLNENEFKNLYEETRELEAMIISFSKRLK